jgi:hypothetical protein
MRTMALRNCTAVLLCSISFIVLAMDVGDGLQFLPGSAKMNGIIITITPSTPQGPDHVNVLLLQQ